MENSEVIEYFEFKTIDAARVWWHKIGIIEGSEPLVLKSSLKLSIE